MPLYFIDTCDDGTEDRDTEGITLDGHAEVRAHAVEALVELCRQQPAPGKTRVVTVTVWDGRNTIVYRDSVRVNPDDGAVLRAIGAMNRNY